MNIDIINEMIQEFEMNDITLSNVRNLASLYIVMDHLQKPEIPQNITSNDKVKQELIEILPAYSKYRDIKCRYQLGQSSEEALLPAMKFVAQELEEFIFTLYVNTCTRKERLCLETMINNITNKLSNI